MDILLNQCNGCQAIRVQPAPNDGWLALGNPAWKVMACPECAAKPVEQFFTTAAFPSAPVPQVIQVSVTNGAASRTVNVPLPPGSKYLGLMEGPGANQQSASILSATGLPQAVPLPPGCTIIATPIPASPTAAAIAAKT